MLPDRGGSYVLILLLPQADSIQVGRLGRFRFPTGWYAYAGSARGPGGLAARIAHHLRPAEHPHWHIDYLRARARPVDVWYALGERRRECIWAQALTELAGAYVPAPRFGASDCRCATHLVGFAAPPDRAAFARAVGEATARERLNVTT